MDPVYLDHAAATPLGPEVAAAMEAIREAGFANPSSPHSAGRRARHLLEDARERILALVGGDLGTGARLVFTSGATESNRLAVLGLAGPAAGTILTSPRDHPAVTAAAAAAASRGWQLRPVPLRSLGALDLDALAGGTRDGRGGGLLCVTLVCGQSGVREDLAAVAAWAGAGQGRHVHVDATQAFLADDTAAPFGLPARLAATVTFAPHKFGGPRGIGGLLVRGDVALVPTAPGTQESGLRGGTEAVALAVGFARAVEIAGADRAATARRLATLRDRLETRLVAAAAEVGVPARVVAGAARRVPHITVIAFPGLDRQALAMAADLEGVCIATGTACASGSSEPAPALVAMGLDEAAVAGAVRLSLGHTTTAGDVDVAVARLARVLERMAPRAAG